jgi:uncharacterized protein (TIGR03437 family)
VNEWFVAALSGGMKMAHTRLVTLLGWIGCLIFALQQGTALQARGSSPAYPSLGAAFAAARYQMEASPKPGEWLADNPAQHFRATFGNPTAASGATAGVQLQAEGVQLGLQLQAVGYDELLPVRPTDTARAEGNRFTLRHATSQQTELTEWFINEAKGLEHGFTLAAPVAPRQAGQPLRLQMRMRSELCAFTEDDGQAVTWRNAQDETVLRYAGLRAWDANGHPLTAHMTSAQNQLTLIVDEADATYPITIDPTFTLQQKLVAGGEANAFFGSGVAIDGNTAVIGASNEDFGDNDAQGVVYVFTRTGVLWTLQARLRAADGAAGDRFGSTVAVLGDTLAVSAPVDDIGAAVNRGSVYVFVRNAGVWTQQQKLFANDGAANDSFGESLDIAKDQLIIGAPNRDEGGKADSGAAYYFTRSGTAWSQQQKVFPASGSANDKFGQSVAIMPNLNSFLAIGAPGFESDGPTNAGTVYIFTPGLGGWIYNQQLFANDAGQDDAFGYSVATSGNTLAVGAYLDDVSTRTNQGSAYVFFRNAANWSQQAKLQPADGTANKQFGYDVDVDLDTVVIGARDDDSNPNNFANQGSAYVYTRNGTVWSQQQKLLAPDGAAQDFFAQDVAIDGDTAIVSSSSDDLGAAQDAGSAYVYFRVGAAWPMQQKLTGSDGEAGDNFGSAVAVDGNTAVITAHSDDIGAASNQGSAYVFTRSGTVWSFQQKLAMGAAGQGFGLGAALAGDTLMISAGSLSFSTGAVHVFTRTNNVWSFKQTLLPNDSKIQQFFGEELALDGTTAVISAAGDPINGKTFQGAAYVFTFANNTWSQSQKLFAADGEAGDLFGSGVAIHGNVIAIGAEGDTFGANANKGSAYFYERPNANGAFAFVSKITSVNGNADDRFGRAVAVSGNVIAVGAPLEDQNANMQQGAVHLYEKVGNSWTFLQRLTPATGAADDWFGSAVQLNGTVLAVAAVRDDVSGAVNQGSVYVYERPAPQFSLTQQLFANDGAAGDSFGSGIALDAETLVIGARSDDILANISQGSAYIFVAPMCSFSLLTPAQSFTAAGGNGSVGLQASANNCTWQAVTSQSWINISNKNGTGSATINFTVAANNGPQRNGTITVGGQTFTVTQASGCTFSINPANSTFNKSGGIGAINVVASNSACPWTATSNAAWITIVDGASGAGNGIVDIQVAPNVGPQRTGTVTVAGFTHTVVQEGGCQYFLSQISSSSTSAGGAGNVVVSTSATNCQWTAVSNVAWITINSALPGTGSSTLNFTVAPNGGAQRIGTLTIAGITYTVTQAAVNQPAPPTLASVNPNSVIAGNAALTVTVTGTNFTANCRVRWNSQPRDTMFVNATQLTATFSATDLASEIIADVTVFDFNTNQASNALPFRVFSPLASVSAASYSDLALAPESIVAGFGVQMATVTQAAITLPLPTNLGGTTVRVIDSANVERAAPLFFVSPLQVNYLIPLGTALGKATIIITSSANHVSVGVAEIALVSPGIFTANAQGNGTAAAQVLRIKPGGQLIYENVSANGQAVPIDLTIAGDQVFLVLYCTGVRHRSSLNAVALNVGGNNLAALYAGPTSLVGLDQINAALPNTLIGKGEVVVALAVDGKTANPVRLTFK